MKLPLLSLLLLVIGCGGGSTAGSATDGQAPLDATDAPIEDVAVGADGSTDTGGSIADAAGNEISPVVVDRPTA